MGERGRGGEGRTDRRRDHKKGSTFLIFFSFFSFFFSRLLALSESGEPAARKRGGCASVGVSECMSVSGRVCERVPRWV